MAKKRMQPRAPRRRKKSDITNLIADFFNKNPEQSFSLEQITDQLNLGNAAEKQITQNIISDLIDDAFVVETGRGKFRANMRANVMEGRFERRSNGKNSFIPDNDSGNVFIAERNSAHAMNGDRVRVQIRAIQKKQQPEGEVIEILERKHTRFVGVLDVQSNYSFLVVDSKILANDIFIPKDNLKGGEDGDKAVVEIVEWPSKAKNPVGKVIDVLGKAGDNNTEMHAILAEFGLPYEYPKNVEEAASKISETISESEIKNREDYRNVTTFTIDPKTAKDYDDALSIQKLKNGLWEVGIHIADVTHYVKEGDIIDREAESRATSIYLVDRTIPMLPEKLSNELCSLRPNEEKLAFSVIVDLDHDGYVRHSRIAKTIINSDRRFAYEEAQAIIEGADGEFKDEILIMNDLAEKIRKRRFQDGAIAFDRHEVGFEIDENGKPLGVFFKYSKEANKLIEEFMLLANRTVSEFVNKVGAGEKAKTFIYRIHDQPNLEKMENLAVFIRRFGYRVRVDGSNRDVSKGINALLSEVSGKPEENLISTIAVRAMAKAVYSTTNIGHYGLAFDFYSHFTSPIRRYPDMMAHRLLVKYMNGEKSASVKEYEAKCVHSSEMEQLAANAERASIKYKQVEFMADKLGMEFEAVVSGITEWGIYAEINENKCEGMIPIRDLDDDYYEFDEKNYLLRGRRNKKVYQLGDALVIKVARANLERKQLDFALVDKK